MQRRDRRARRDIVSASLREFCVECGSTMEKRPALGKGLSALIPDAARAAARVAGRSRHRSPRAERLSAARARRRCAARGAGAVDQAPTASSSRSSSARSAIASRSSPASAAGAPRSSPACCACRSSCATSRRAQEQSLLEMALIENIQREDLNPIDEALAYRRLADEFQLTQEDIADRRRQGSRVGRELRAAAEAARRSPQRGRRRAGCRWATRARCCRSPTKPSSAASRATSSRAACRCARPNRSSRRSSKADGAAREAAAPKPVDVHTRAAEDRLQAPARHPRPHRPPGHARPHRDRFRLRRRVDPDLRTAHRAMTRRTQSAAERRDVWSAGSASSASIHDERRNKWPSV